MMRGLPVLLALLALLAGCTAIGPVQPPVISDNQPPLFEPSARRGQSGGVFNPQAAWSLTSDRKAVRPGDVLTVALMETTTASKKADTKFGKGSDLSVKPMVLAGKSVKATELGVGSQADFSGSASSSQQNTLQGAISVIVQEVMPNGLLRIQGEKMLYLNQGEEMVRISGYVRADDIDPDNQVSSQRVANARIVYAGQGALADSNNAGWLTRFFVSPWMPF
jgi:flagellar L-ring protein precursor FlgH